MVAGNSTHSFTHKSAAFSAINMPSITNPENFVVETPSTTILKGEYDKFVVESSKLWEGNFQWMGMNEELETEKTYKQIRRRWKWDYRNCQMIESEEEKNGDAKFGSLLQELKPESRKKKGIS